MTLNEESTKHDIADIVAGELQVSRATAYDMMREALREVDTTEERYENMHDTIRQAIEWIAEAPEYRKISAGKMISILIDVLHGKDNVAIKYRSRATEDC